jgi:hypothetical protein
VSPATRFCNNPVCDRCDEHLSAREALRKAGREVCPACLEPLVVREPQPARPLRPTRPPTRNTARGGRP